MSCKLEFYLYFGGLSKPMFLSRDQQFRRQAK